MQMPLRDLQAVAAGQLQLQLGLPACHMQAAAGVAQGTEGAEVRVL